MQDIEEKVIKLTGIESYPEALNQIVKEFIKLKLHFLKLENIMYETKWGMDFYEFEKKSPELPDGMGYKTEQEYYAWEGVITDIIFYTNALKDEN